MDALCIVLAFGETWASPAVAAARPTVRTFLQSGTSCIDAAIVTMRQPTSQSAHVCIKPGCSYYAAYICNIAHADGQCHA